MNYYMALRIRAMAAVQDPDSAATLRHIFRWYSREFHTALHIVEELPLEDILVAFYESTYEDMSEDEKQKEIAELLETPEDRRKRLRAQDEERAEAFEFARFTAAEEQKKEEQRRLADLEVKQKPGFAVREAPQSTLPAAPKPKEGEKLQPGIEMKFVTADEFEAELDGPGTMLPTKKP